MKRVLAFVLLLALGFLSLRLLLGDEALTAGGGERTRPRPSLPAGEPIRVNDDGTQLQLSGGFTIARRRDVALPDGSVRYEPLYELECGDCVPLDNGGHRLERVRVKLFDDGNHVADLLASTARVELQVDAQQRRSLREDRELELDDVVVAAAPGARSGPARLEAGRVRARIGEREIELRTVDENQPVLVVVDGERRAQLRGRGLRARLPRGGDSPLERSDLVLLHDPVLTLDGVELAADGPLHYVEQVATGAALLTLDGNVRANLARVQMQSRPAGGGGQGIAIHGDRLHGWLQRSRDRGGDGERNAIAWTLLRLFGSRAKVTTPDLELESPRLTVTPGPTGELAAVTADGGASELRQLTAGGPTFRSTRPIHLVRTNAGIGALYRSFGFPAWSLGALSELEIVTFEGASELDAGDGVHVAADRGLDLFRRQSQATTGEFLARGFGNVVVSRTVGTERLEARGDSGFTMIRTATGDELVLGRSDPRAGQQFTLVRGAMTITGNGACRLVRDADGRFDVRLDSDRPTIAGSFADGEGEQRRSLQLAAAQTLLATFADEQVLALSAAGPAMTAHFAQGLDQLDATAGRLEQTTPTSWRLTGNAAAPARLSVPSGPRGAGMIAAPTIDLHRVSTRSLLLDAVASDGAPAQFAADLPEGAAVAATARRIRLLPFAVGPEPLFGQLLGLPPALVRVAATSLRQPWLLATGEVIADLRDAVHGDLHGEGAMLTASVGGRALLFHGDPATEQRAVLYRTTNGERDVTASGAGVRVVRRERDQQLLTVLSQFVGRDRLVPPQVLFRATAPAAADGEPRPGRLGWVRGDCRGEIEVTPDAVLFHGPVVATSVFATGDVDPNGMHITAQQLRMERQRDTGALTRIRADGGVVVDWRQMHARSATIELDLRWQRCIAEDPVQAEIRFGSRLQFQAPRLEANYATWSVTTYGGRLVHEAAAARR